MFTFKSLPLFQEAGMISVIAGYPHGMLRGNTYLFARLSWTTNSDCYTPIFYFWGCSFFFAHKTVLVASDSLANKKECVEISSTIRRDGLCILLNNTMARYKKFSKNHNSFTWSSEIFCDLYGVHKRLHNVLVGYNNNIICTSFDLFLLLFAEWLNFPKSDTKM